MKPVRIEIDTFGEDELDKIAEVIIREKPQDRRSSMVDRSRGPLQVLCYICENRILLNMICNLFNPISVYSRLR